ncbi:DUF937 domain-containing protein [Chelatococcus reniformis]|uniref:DUF937 domain-containing protein n=1 Tax=Chelatococcus reniformis TaxID=1494448 RepID=A0A916XQI9_9HYPH|nr:DUF937 domain-containing protein [Chelatococcus reniformis]GGC91052.1 hypothetical protein GCM10010994_56050 [Chelatococcus reniformis]
MYNLYDIMQAAQQGQAVANIANQFGLSADQTRKAIEATLPAFSLGLQRAMQSQQGLLNTMGLMGSGQFMPFFEQAAATRTPSAPAQGASVVETVFGSPEVTRQVAAHAAVLSGVRPEVLLRMLPLIGAMIMGGLFKVAMEQGMGQLLAQSAEFMQRAGGAAPARPPQQPPPSTTDSAADMMGQMVANSLKAVFSVFPAQSKPDAPVAPAAAPAPPRPSPPPPAAAAAAPPPESPAEPASAGAGDEAFDAAKAGFEHFSRMFETGRTVQDQHLATMRAIFDSFAPKNGAAKPAGSD